MQTSPHDLLLRALIELHPDDAAQSVESLDAKAAHALFQTMPIALADPLLARIRAQVLAPLMAVLAALPKSLQRPLRDTERP